MLLVSLALLGGCSAVDKDDKSITVEETNSVDVVAKEFSMDSFVEMVDGKPRPQFSEKTITVKKGDLVRIKVNVTSGSHNFNIDEFDVHAKTPTASETTVEFVAAEAGEFVYYCSMPGHRANGHWGTLIVVE